MSEQFNQELSLSGKIPSGLFNTMFEFTGCWQKDAANTKSLAFDGWFVTLYSVALSKGQTELRDHVKQAVPSTWDPAALARLLLLTPSSSFCYWPPGESVRHTSYNLSANAISSPC
jgi:hypothetical protein